MDYPHTICFWRVASKIKPGRRYVTRHRMSEADAKAMDPGAEPAGGEMVIREPGRAHSISDFAGGPLYPAVKMPERGG